jgi:hypothetical protein
MEGNKQQTETIQSPAAPAPGYTAATHLAFAHHGKPLRGLTSTPKSPNFQGRFGRMFRSLPSARYARSDKDNHTLLMLLGEKMTSPFDEPKDGFDAEESGIPALYTYFGQFVDHDITFDPMTTLIKHSDPDALTDFRTPALDMDNIYGRGPGDQPYLYNVAGTHFLLGEPMDNGAPDLPRNRPLLEGEPRRALIGDPRNDENSIVSQLQGLMLRFHNRVADENKHLDLPALQQQGRWHYQWVVIHDFLPRIINAKVLDDLKGADGKFSQHKLKFFHWKNDPFIPVEFSVAAYRLGHSMIRPGYRMNDGKDALLPIFAVPSKGLPEGLAGFREMPKNRGIDWGRFIDLEGDVRAYGDDPVDVDPANEDMMRRLQFAYRLDTSLVLPLSMLPFPVVTDPPPNLAQRNLLRAFELGLPSGQEVARAMGLKPLDDDEILIGKAVDDPGEGDQLGKLSELPELAAFKGNCPLWTYILAEAARNQIPVTIPVTEKKQITTPQLGPVGGRIVAEVFLGLLFGDNTSFLSAHPNWIPTIRGKGESFALRDIVAYALGK